MTTEHLPWGPVSCLRVSSSLINTVIRKTTNEDETFLTYPEDVTLKEAEETTVVPEYTIT